MGSSLYLTRSLRNLTFCRARWYNMLLQQSCCQYMKKIEVTSLKNILIKRKYHSSKILYNIARQGSVSFEEAKLHLIEDEKYINSLEKVFPFPSQTLKNFYNLFSPDLKKETKYNCKFKQYGLSHDPIFFCNVELHGPVYGVFQGYGKKQKKAENAAMLKALVTLFEGKHMDVLGRPIKLLKPPTRKGRLEKELMKPVEISLSDEDLLAAQHLIDHYENSIGPFIESAALAIKNKSNEEDGAADDSAAIVNLMTGKKIYETESNDDRNLKLLQQMNKIRQRKDYSLPIYYVKHEILETVRNNAVTIIEGGTGCGKSTQVPQMIMDEWAENFKGSECNILIAQPKRIATLSIARQIAYERRENIGRTVGYKMRLEEQMIRSNGGFMFYTCGTLREMFRYNPFFEGISHVFIDEVHERTIDTDILLYLLKRTLSQGSPLKVILMSATSRIDELKSYFDTNAVVSVPPGTVFPITTHYIDEFPFLLNKKLNAKEILEGKKNLVVSYDMVVALIHHIDRTMPEGAILVFVPGWQDIKTLEDCLFDDNNLCVLPLHSKLSSKLQSRIFDPAVDKKRKVILSTNLAETSLTINDVVYVIDSGLQNDHRFDADRNASCFGTYWISKANAIQRQGRAGRVQPGEVFRLYHEETYDKLEDYPKPDIQKMPLEAVVLKFKSTFEDKSVGDVLNDLISPPHPVAVENAIQALNHLQLMKSEVGGAMMKSEVGGAMMKNEVGGAMMKSEVGGAMMKSEVGGAMMMNEVGGANETLTSLGRVLSKFSTSPYFSKPLLYSLLLKCSDPVLNYICLESNLINIFEKPISMSELRKLKVKFDDDSDLVAVAGLMNRVFDDLIFHHQNVFEIDDDDTEEVDEEKRSNHVSHNLNLTADRDEIKSTLFSTSRVQTVLKVRNLLQRQLEGCLPDLFQNSMSEEDRGKNSSLILASFLSAANFIIKRVHNKNTGASKLATEELARVCVHSSSVLKDIDFMDKEKDHFLTTDVAYTPIRNVWIARDLSSIPALSIALFYGEDLLITGSELADNSRVILSIKNRNISFRMDERIFNHHFGRFRLSRDGKRTSKCILSLRRLWHSLVDFYIESSLNKGLETSELSGEAELIQDFRDQYQRLLLQLLSENEVVNNEVAIN